VVKAIRKGPAMSLTTSLKKAGRDLHAEDKAAILARARELRAGGAPVDQAARAAMDERAAYLQGRFDGAKAAPFVPAEPEEPQPDADADEKPESTTEGAQKPARAVAAHAVEPAQAIDDEAVPEDGPAASNTVDNVRAALTLRFGELVKRIEKRGMLEIVDAPADPDNSKAVRLDASSIEPGDEVAAMLFAFGGGAKLEEMLGGRLSAALTTKVEDLTKADDRIAVTAEARIPDDCAPGDVDAWLLALAIEAAAEHFDRPNAMSAQARQLLASAMGAIRRWWDQTEFNQLLARYGQAVQLSPQDVGALAVYAVCVESEERATA